MSPEVHFTRRFVAAFGGRKAEHLTTMPWQFDWVHSRCQAWVGGFSNLMDEIRTFMAARLAPFRLKGLRAIFVTAEDEEDEKDKVHVRLVMFFLQTILIHVRALLAKVLRCSFRGQVYLPQQNRRLFSHLFISS